MSKVLMLIARPDKISPSPHCQWRICLGSNLYFQLYRSCSLSGAETAGSSSRHKDPETPHLTLTEVIHHITKGWPTHRDTVMSETGTHRARACRLPLRVQPCCRANHVFPHEHQPPQHTKSAQEYFQWTSSFRVSLRRAQKEDNTPGHGHAPLVAETLAVEQIFQA